MSLCVCACVFVIVCVCVRMRAENIRHLCLTLKLPKQLQVMLSCSRSTKHTFGIPESWDSIEITDYIWPKSYIDLARQKYLQNTFQSGRGSSSVKYLTTDRSFHFPLPHMVFCVLISSS